MKADKPLIDSEDDGLADVFSNITVRDYIAIQAMNGMCRNEQWVNTESNKEISKAAYELANAMIEESNKAEN